MVEYKTIKVIFTAGARKIPPEMGMTLFAGSKTPEIAHEPAVCRFRRARQSAPQRVGKTAHLVTETVWIGEKVAVIAVHGNFHRRAGDHVGATGTIDVFPVNSVICAVSL